MSGPDEATPAAPLEPQGAPLLPPALGLLLVSTSWILFEIILLAFEFRSDEFRITGNDVFEIVNSLLLASGALCMLRYSHYRWSVAVSVLALVPVYGPFCCAAVPFGVWSLLMLRDSGVRARFASAGK